MEQLIKHALKEWDITIKALEAGKTILLLRKGGIKEVGGRFQVQQQQVLLYPTHEHQKPHLLKLDYAEQVTPVSAGWHPQTVRIGSWAEITQIFSVNDALIVKQLLPYHIGNEQFAQEKLNWHPRQPLYFLLLRVYQLPQPLTIAYAQEYGGCQSWINLLELVDLAGSIPVLTKSEYTRQVELISTLINPTCGVSQEIMK